MLITGLVTSGVLAGAALAHAAMITVQSDNLGGGNGAVIACDHNGVGVKYRRLLFEGNKYLLTGPDLSDVDPACAGQTLDVTVTGKDDQGNTIVLAEATSQVPAGGGEVDVTFTDPPAASDVTGVSLAIVGAPSPPP